MLKTNHLLLTGPLLHCRWSWHSCNSNQHLCTFWMKSMLPLTCLTHRTSVGWSRLASRDLSSSLFPWRTVCSRMQTAFSGQDSAKEPVLSNRWRRLTWNKYRPDGIYMDFPYCQYSSASCFMKLPFLSSSMVGGWFGVIRRLFCSLIYIGRFWNRSYFGMIYV